MKYTLIAVAASVLAFGGAAFAEDEMCALSYDVYEASVPHTDLEECPEAMGDMGEGELFCRLSVVAEVATIFAFDEDSGCLIESRSFEEDEFTITIN